MDAINLDAADLVRRQLHHLLIENDQLKRQVQHLTTQLQMAQQSGAQLTPELAKSWLPALEACEGWKALTLGDDGWDTAAGRPTDTGLRALIRDLRATPSTAADRASWDAKEQRRVQKGGGIPARPAPDRVQPQMATSWLLNERQPGLGDALAQLVKGLRGRLPVVIEAAFLLWGSRAVEMLSSDPAGVVQRLKQEVDRVAEPIKAERFRRVAEMLAGGQARAAARQVLGVSADATADEIKAAYRQLAKQHHPDAGGDAEQFARISTAYEALIGGAQ